jgi:hypothetical protein
MYSRSNALQHGTNPPLVAPQGRIGFLPAPPVVPQLAPKSRDRFETRLPFHNRNPVARSGVGASDTHCLASALRSASCGYNTFVVGTSKHPNCCLLALGRVGRKEGHMYVVLSWRMTAGRPYSSDASEPSNAVDSVAPQGHLNVAHPRYIPPVDRLRTSAAPALP